MVISAVPTFAEEAEKTIPDTWQEYKGFWVEETDEAIRIMGLAGANSGGSLLVPAELDSTKPVKVEYPGGARYSYVKLPVQLAAEAFKGAEGIEKIEFLDGTEVIPAGLCENIKSLKTVKLPKSVTAIDNYAFKNCEALENIDLSLVKHIGRSSFEGCKSLKSIKLSSYITAIDDYAFKNCASLEKVTGLHDGISLGQDAFTGTKVELNEFVVDAEKDEESKFSDVATDAVYAAAIEVLTRLGIMTGYDDKTFRPDTTLSRAEATAMIVRLLNLEINPTGGETQFSDVPTSHWASGYISWATENGIINGQGDGTFAPEEFVTKHQLIKMLVCTLGYEPMALVNGGWNYGGYITAAEEMGLIEKDNLNKNVHIKRGEAALLCYRALDIDFMEWVEATSGIYGQLYRICENETILTEYWDYEKIECVIKESGGNLLIKVIRNYADEPYYKVGQVFTLEDENLRELADSIVNVYMKKTPDAKNEILFLK